MKLEYLELGDNKIKKIEGKHLTLRSLFHCIHSRPGYSDQSEASLPRSQSDSEHRESGDSGESGGAITASQCHYYHGSESRSYIGLLYLSIVPGSSRSDEASRAVSHPEWSVENSQSGGEHSAGSDRSQ